MLINVKRVTLIPAVTFVGLVLVFFQQEVEAKQGATLASSETLQLDKNTLEINGFRSALFGMTEKEVLKAIYKDYKVSKSKIKRSIHSTEKTVSFNFKVKSLLPNSGRAKLFYVFGYKAKRLIQVNILWDRTSVPKFDPQRIIDTANRLRAHFLSRNFRKEDLVVNNKLSDGSFLVFRGSDFNGKRVVLLLVNPVPKEGQKPNQNINLRLSYIANPDSPDIYKIKTNNL